jgi:hypothetical protein
MIVRYTGPVFVAALLLSGVFSTASAQTSTLAPIDRELRDQLDFRAVEFGLCHSVEECSVNGVTILAERRTPDGEGWTAAQIYWDPIDGLGVMDGGQNDEIDFDERLIIRFEGARTIDRVWISDLFMGEGRHYGSNDPNENPDVESAGLQLVRDGEILSELQIDGQELLPWSPFNGDVSGLFREDGDLQRRIVVRDNLISVISPGTGPFGQIVLVSLPLDEIDEDKLAIFEGVDTTEVDLTDILIGFNGAPVFAAGTYNADFIQASINNWPMLQRLREVAEARRTVSSLVNGELGQTLTPAVLVTQVNFVSPFGGSNDFSVAGLIFAGTGG